MRLLPLGVGDLAGVVVTLLHGPAHAAAHAPDVAAAALGAAGRGDGAASLARLVHYPDELVGRATAIAQLRQGELREV